MYLNLKHKFLKPDFDNSFKEDRIDTDNNSINLVFNPYIRQSISRQRQRLPVFSVRNHFLLLIEKHNVIIVIGETGSGKSTQLPQYLLESDWCSSSMVAVTEPRRVAATSLSARVSEEKESILGREIGYTIHFDNKCDPCLTKIKYMTEGILIREMMADPLLRQYSVIILDEVHERTIYIDIIMGLMKKIMKRRRDLRLVICSATIDVEEYVDFFKPHQGKERENVGILAIPGREFPLEINYIKQPIADYVKSSVETALAIHKTQSFGDVLIFLTGVEEVEACVDMIKESSKDQIDSLCVFPMHASLPYEDQMKVFQSLSKSVRKIIVSTNIAETSITLENVIYVVDCGFVKQRFYNPEGRFSSLIVVPISKASAKQRAGRAGRVRTGIVYRLYTEEDYSGLEDTSSPEMQRKDVSPVLLTLLALGIDDLLRFPYFSPPPSSHMIAALDELFALGCLDKGGKIVEGVGNAIAEIPIDIHLGKILIASNEYHCSEEILMIVALLQVKNVFVYPHGYKKLKAKIEHRKFQVYEGDLLTLLNVFSAFLENKQCKHWCSQNFLNYRALRRALEICGNMKKVLKKYVDLTEDSLKADTETICKCIVSGLFPNAAYLHPSGQYRSVRGGQDLYIHPSSVLYYEKQPQWVLYNEILHTTQPFMKDITIIKKEWLLEAAPHFYEEGFDTER